MKNYHEIQEKNISNLEEQIDDIKREQKNLALVQSNCWAKNLT